MRRSPATASTKVVLPAPLGPMIVHHVPGSTPSVMSEIKVAAPTFTLTCSTSTQLIAHWPDED